MTKADLAIYVPIILAAASEIIALSPAKDNSIIQLVLRMLRSAYPRKR